MYIYVCPWICVYRYKHIYTHIRNPCSSVTTLHENKEKNKQILLQTEASRATADTMDSTAIYKHFVILKPINHHK